MAESAVASAAELHDGASASAATRAVLMTNPFSSTKAILRRCDLFVRCRIYSEGTHFMERKRMKIRGWTIVVQALLYSLLVQQAIAGSFQLDPQTRRQIDAEAQRLVNAGETPGLAVGIMSRGRLIYARGFGLANLETLTPVALHFVFGIGSATKQFTAAGIVLLAESRGRSRWMIRSRGTFRIFRKGVR